MSKIAHDAALLWAKHALQQPEYRGRPDKIAHGVGTIYTIVRSRCSLYSRIRHWWQQMRRPAQPKPAVTYAYSNEEARHGDRT